MAKDEKSIDELEKEADFSPENDDEWGDAQREGDEDQGRDKETTPMYFLGLGRDTKDSESFRKLIIETKGAIKARDFIRSVMLHRIITQRANVPYKVREAKKDYFKQNPWEAVIGYSRNGTEPSPNKKGECFALCQSNGKPFLKCSSIFSTSVSASSTIFSFSGGTTKSSIPQETPDQVEYSKPSSLTLSKVSSTVWESYFSIMFLVKVSKSLTLIAEFKKG